MHQGSGRIHPGVELLEARDESTVPQTPMGLAQHQDSRGQKDRWFFPEAHSLDCLMRNESTGRQGRENVWERERERERDRKRGRHRVTQMHPRDARLQAGEVGECPPGVCLKEVWLCEQAWPHKQCHCLKP